MTIALGLCLAPPKAHDAALAFLECEQRSPAFFEEWAINSPRHDDLDNAIDEKLGSVWTGTNERGLADQPRPFFNHTNPSGPEESESLNPWPRARIIRGQAGLNHGQFSSILDGRAERGAAA